MTPTVVQNSRSRQFALGAGGGRHRAGGSGAAAAKARFRSMGRALHLNDGNNGRPHSATETGEESMSKQEQLQGRGSRDQREVRRDAWTVDVLD